MGQSGILDECVQISLFVESLASKLYLAQLLQVASVPVLLVVLCVVTTENATAEIFEELDQQVHAVAHTEVLGA